MILKNQNGDALINTENIVLIVATNEGEIRAFDNTGDISFKIAAYRDEERAMEVLNEIYSELAKNKAVFPLPLC